MNRAWVWAAYWAWQAAWREGVVREILRHEPDCPTYRSLVGRNGLRDDTRSTAW